LRPIEFGSTAALPSQIVRRRISEGSAITAPGFSDEFSRGIRARAQRVQLVALRVQQVALFRRRYVSVMLLL
jgi:hypothetical protein